MAFEANETVSAPFQLQEHQRLSHLWGKCRCEHQPPDNEFFWRSFAQQFKQVQNPLIINIHWGRITTHMRIPKDLLPNRTGSNLGSLRLNTGVRQSSIWSVCGRDLEAAFRG